MLAVARAVPHGGGARIEWREGDATTLPFPNGTFDIVFCHQGLQFFSDRRATLCEIHRVLAPGGRVALAVWSHIERNPYFRTLADAVERHVGREAARQMRSSFALGDPEELGSLLRDAGFVEAVVRPLLKLLHLPRPGDFVLQHLAGTSLAPTVKGLDAETRTALVADVDFGVRPYQDKAGMTLPFEIHLAHWPPAPDVCSGAGERRLTL
jgi:SAM-dependent methyltransferase